MNTTLAGRAPAALVMVCACLACVVAAPPTAYALDPDKRLTQYLHRSWRMPDGSAPASMFTITQTTDGFLWLSSLRELYRFDGIRFVRWDLPAQGNLAANVMNAVTDHSGGLWMITDSGIAHVQDGAVLSDSALTGMLWLGNTTVEADGSLWIVRSRNAVTDAPLCRLTDRAVKCFGAAEGIPIAPADSLMADGNGGFWIGGQTALVHWRDGASQVYPIEALKSNAGNNGISSLARTPDGTLWIGILAEGPGLGLGQLRNGVYAPFVVPTFDGSQVSVYSLIVDRHGALWVGTSGKGIFRIHGNTVDRYGRTEGLSGDSVLALFEDREGTIWVTTTQGVDSFRDPRITTFSAMEGLGKDAAIGVLAAKDGTLWVANSGSLDSIAGGRVSSIRTDRGLPGSQVTSLLEDSRGNMWVGVDDGLYLFEQGRFRRVPEPDGRPLGLVVGITEDIHGNIWAACGGNPRKLVRIRDFEVREQFPSPQMPTGHNLAPDPKGGIWIGTLSGDLVLFRDGVQQTFTVKPKGNPVSHQIIVQTDGSVLAAYDDGLVGLRHGKLQRMTVANNLPCDAIISFIQDGQQRWWLYTGCGVVMLTDGELQRWWADPKAVVQTRVYDVLDGAQPNTPSFNSAAYSPDGRVWFATGVVVQMVDPSRLSQTAMPATTHIESISVDRSAFSPKDILRFPPNPRDLQIDYTSPSLSVPQKVKFRYRLEGHEPDWHDVGARRQAFYTDLPPGQYSFRVVAANMDGVWNEDGATLNFSIAPAYYQTTWFRVVTAVSFVALLWVAHRYRMRRVQQAFALTLEARVGERTRIARDLHDTLLQSFHGLLLQFQTVSYLLSERPEQAKAKLDDAIEDAARAITEGRDAVQGLRASTLERNDLARAIKTLGDELVSTASDRSCVDLDLVVEGEPRDLHPIVRDEIYKIASEALRNAFRHAQARRVEVELHYEDEQFRLRVRDDGKGIDSAVLAGQGIEGHFGLRGMPERAQLIGGDLAVWSQVGAGTEVQLRLPASIVYVTTARRSWWSRLLTSRTAAHEGRDGS
jgi:signal transduction histidine kinase/ligand-binding sensor domain-containing protein